MLTNWIDYENRNKYLNYLLFFLFNKCAVFSFVLNKNKNKHCNLEETETVMLFVYFVNMKRDSFIRLLTPNNVIP